jgi:copper chaperone CopZ
MRHIEDCEVGPGADRASEEVRARADMEYLAVAGMGCPNCANRVRNALLRIKGVLDAEVSLPARLVRVWYERGTVRASELVEAVARAGRGTHHQYLAVPVRGRF